jgi:hypothetical protein
VEELRQRIARKGANNAGTGNDEQDGENSSGGKTTAAAQDDDDSELVLLDQLKAKEDKIAKMLATHPAIKVAQQALDPKNKLKIR